jgi:hypothetical protein
MTAIDTLLEAIETGTTPRSDVFAEDVLLDATVPNWRYRVLGADRVAGKFGAWFQQPGAFDSIERTPLPDGELVRFELSWFENGSPFACHQTQRIRVDDDRIVGVTLFCGGQWPAELLAKMEEASRVA